MKAGECEKKEDWRNEIGMERKTWSGDIGEGTELLGEESEMEKRDVMKD